MRFIKLLEGTWAIPNTPELVKDLEAVMQKPIPAIEATDKLYSLIGDDSLFDDFYELETDDPSADARATIARWIIDNKKLLDFNIDDRTVLNSLYSLADKHVKNGKVQEAGDKMSKNSAMDAALRSIEKTFSPERKKINDQVMDMMRTVQMLQDPKWADRAWGNVEKYGINNKEDLVQEIKLMIKNELAVNDDEIKGWDTNVKSMRKALETLGVSESVSKLGEITGALTEGYEGVIIHALKQEGINGFFNKGTLYIEDGADMEQVNDIVNQTVKIAPEIKPENDYYQIEGIEKSEALTEEQFDEAAGEKDACYRKVKSRYKVWPSAYASGALVKCRKVGAKNWGNSKK